MEIFITILYTVMTVYVCGILLKIIFKYIKNKEFLWAFAVVGIIIFIICGLVDTMYVH